MPRKLTAAGLTPKQLHVLQEIKSFERSRCYSATITELAETLGVGRSTAFEHVTELRKKGLISSSPNRARSLQLTMRASRLLNTIRRHETEECDVASAGPEDGLTVAGRVAAGRPIDAVEDRENLTLASLYGTDRGDVFALEVKGDSMIEEGIHDGDYVVCRRQHTASNGDLVIAIVDEDTATLKRFYREPDRARLQPANRNYEAIYTNHCRIEAVVVGLMRRM